MKFAGWIWFAIFVIYAFASATGGNVIAFIACTLAAMLCFSPTTKWVEKIIKQKLTVGMKVFLCFVLIIIAIASAQEDKASQPVAKPSQSLPQASNQEKQSTTEAEYNAEPEPTASASQAAVILDIKQIAGKSLEEVSEKLGKPLSCEKSKYGKNCAFSKAKTEITFINGKADWITVNAVENMPYSKAALPMLGLEESYPDFSNEYTVRWESIEGFLQLQIFPSGSGVFYVHIKVATP